MSEEPEKPDLSEIFDLKRNKAVREYVTRFGELFHQRAEVSADIKELAAEAKGAMFTAVEIKAMQDIARWRLDDKGDAAAAKLAALKRVSTAVKYDLFSWADRDQSKGAA